MGQENQQILLILCSANYGSMCLALRMCSNLPQWTRAHRANDVLWCFSKQGESTGITEKCRVYIQTRLSTANSMHLQCSFISLQAWHSLVFTASSHFSNPGYTQRTITGSNVQVPESRICLMMFARWVLKVLKGRWGEWRNEPCH